MNDTLHPKGAISFLVYDRGLKHYRLWDVVACKVIVNKDISFYESKSLKQDESFSYL